MKYFILLLLVLFTNASNAVTTPDKILPDGIDKALITNPYTGESGYARKGIVAATISNIASLNHLLKKDIDFKKNRTIIIKTTREIQLLINDLNYTGLFNLVPPKEWVKDNNQPG